MRLRQTSIGRIEIGARLAASDELASLLSEIAAAAEGRVEEFSGGIRSMSQPAGSVGADEDEKPSVTEKPRPKRLPSKQRGRQVRS